MAALRAAAASSPAASAARRSSASCAVGGRGGRPRLLPARCSSAATLLGVAGCRGGVGRRPLLELELQLEQRLLEDRDAALGSLGIEPLRRVGRDLLGGQHRGARLGELALQLQHPRLVGAGAGLGDGVLERRPQLDDLALQRRAAGVALRRRHPCSAAICCLELDRAALELLGLRRLLLERRDARLHVVRVDLARRLGPQVGQHALQLGAALVGAGAPPSRSSAIAASRSLTCDCSASSSAFRSAATPSSCGSP